MTRLASTYISYNLSASAFTSFLFAEVASETCLTAYKFAFRYPKNTQLTKIELEANCVRTRGQQQHASNKILTIYY
jgi:hypothetical protein